MSEIRFYHLLRQTVEQALPALLSKALAADKKVLLRVPDASLIDPVNDALWQYDAHSFLPHGREGDDYAAQQPVLITALPDNVNNADMALSVHGCDIDNVGDFDLCCYVFDGHDSGAVSRARAQWKALKDQGAVMTYWQQSEKGWEKKA